MCIKFNKHPGKNVQANEEKIGCRHSQYAIPNAENRVTSAWLLKG